MSSLSLCAILPAWQGLPYADTMYTIAALYRFTPFEDPAARVREARSKRATSAVQTRMHEGACAQNEPP